MNFLTSLLGRFLLTIMILACVHVLSARSFSQTVYSFDKLVPPACDKMDMPQELVALFGEIQGRHGAEVKCVAVSPNSELIASGSRDKTARIWSSRDLSEIESFGHQDDVDAVSFSANGKNVLSISWDGYFRLWPIGFGCGEPMLKMHLEEGGGNISGAFGQDRRSMVWASAFKGAYSTRGHCEIRYSNLDIDGKPDEGRKLEAPNWFQSPSHFALSPNGRWLAASEKGAGKEILLWDLHSKDARPAWRISDFDDRAGAVAFSPDSNCFLGGTNKGRLFVWKLVQEGPQQLGNVCDHNDKIQTIEFSPDGTQLLTGSYDHNIAIRSWPLDKTPAIILKKHSYWVSDLAFSSDGKRLFSAGWDHRLIHWEKQGSTYNTEMKPESGPVVVSIAFSPDGRLMASGSTTAIGMAKVPNPVTLWKIDGVAPVIEKKISGPIGTIKDLSFSHDGKMLAIGDENGITVYDIKTSRLLDRVKHIHKEAGQEACRLESQALVFATDEAVLFSGLGSSILRTRIEENLAHVSEAFEKPIGFAIVDVSSNEELAAASHNLVAVYDCLTLKRTKEFFLQEGERIESLDFSDNGEFIAAGTRAGKVILISTKKLEAQSEICQHSSVIASVSFGGNSRVLAFGDWDGNVIVVDVESGKILNRWKFARIWKLKFAPDGKHLAVADGSGAIRLLRVEANKK